MLRRPIYGAAAIFAAMLALSASCRHRSSARIPPPAKPRPIGWTETGIASWYGAPYDGRPAASGEIFDTHQLTAAHRTLPFNTWVEVTNLQNGSRVDVRINDRGPFIDGRIIDLSLAAADQIDLVRPGIGRVRLKVIRAPKRSEPAPQDRTGNKNEPTSQSEPASESKPAPREGTSSQEPAAQTEPPGEAPPLERAPASNGDPGISIAAGKFAVQAGAFSDAGRANAQAAKLASFGARVVKSDAQPPLLRVLVGRGMARQAAEGLAAQLRASGIDAVVVQDPARN